MTFSIKKQIALLLIGLSSAMNLTAASNQSDGVVYRDRHVRFTVVTPGLIRMEYAPDGNFIDDKSHLAVNRLYPSCEYKIDDNGKQITLSTSRLKLRYHKNSGPFSEKNLTIESCNIPQQFTWTPGTPQKENLLGTTRTLDEWDGSDIMEKGKDGKRHPRPGHLEQGLLARDGWTFIDDSSNFLFDNDPEFEWVKQRKSKKGAQDWYFLAYGNDYKSALKDYTLLSGQIPLPPRYAFGYWWSRWWAYSEHEYKQLIDAFADYQIPLEVLVIDMDWHYTDEAHGGWTGWTWNDWLFPNHTRFLNYLRDKNLKVTLNLHPASGIKKFEAAYPQIALENGVDPKTEKDIPWVSSDKRFINSVFKNILNPMTDEGVTFWWLDWQQEPYDSKIDSLSNTWWLNYTFFNKMSKDRNVRPMLYHRWGGLGNHRYQIGFSGDNFVTWKSLDFLPYFTSTASNVCYGYWSHDLGGHYMAPGDTVTNPELYVRSMQFGTYAPIMRTHSNKNARLVKEPWKFSRPHFMAIRNAIRDRYRLAPYIYTMARMSHDTGVSLCRPMYYEYPDTEEAYASPGQYMFGDNMIVKPVTAPGTEGFSDVEIWLPEGKWYEKSSGTLLDGGRKYMRRYTLDEVPVYISAGAIIPEHAENESTLSRNDAPIAFKIYPGGNGEFTLYEDNGDDQDYDANHAFTHVSSKVTPNQLHVAIGSREGAYEGMPASRKFEIHIPASKRPLNVKIDGKDSGYEYNPEELSVIISLPERSCQDARDIIVTFPDDAQIADGTIGKMKRFVEAFGGLKDKYARLRVTEDLGRMATIYEALSYFPERNPELLSDFLMRYANLPELIEAQEMNPESRVWFSHRLDLSISDK